MAQRILDGEQYESVLVRGEESDGGLAVRSNGSKVTATYSRPADALQYDAGDAILPSGSSYVTVSGISNKGGDIYVSNFTAAIAASGAPAGIGTMRFHLYSNPPSGAADNVALIVSSGDMTSYQGFIDATSPVDLGAFVYYQSNTSNLHCALASGASSVYAIPQTLSAWTPASGSAVRLSIGYFVV
jgi:hypothetical protein